MGGCLSKPGENESPVGHAELLRQQDVKQRDDERMQMQNECSTSFNSNGESVTFAEQNSEDDENWSREQNNASMARSSTFDDDSSRNNNNNNTSEGEATLKTFVVEDRTMRREKLMTALRVDDAGQECRFASITALMSTVLDCPMCIVSLVEEEKQWFKAVQGITDEQNCSCEHEIFGHIQETVVMADTLQDSQYCSHPLVAEYPRIRFYAGIPLVSPVNGSRYGTLSVIDTQPKSELRSDTKQLLAKFAELIVKEIEKDKLEMLHKMVQEQRVFSMSTTSSSAMNSARSSSTSEAMMHSSTPLWSLQRAADCFVEGVMLLDITPSKWNIVYGNGSLGKSLDADSDKLLGKGFWELFSADTSDRAEANSCIFSGEPFTLSVVLQNVYHPEPISMIMDFRPASGAQMSPVSVSPRSSYPGDMEGGTGNENSRTWYFAIVRPKGARFSQANSSKSLEASPPVPNVSKVVPAMFTDVRLGPLIGRGAYGRVYRGTWNGNVVAVKVITSTDPSLGKDPREVGEGSGRGKAGIFEAVLSTSLSHPNVVHTYQYAVRRVKNPEANGVAKKPPVLSEVWLIAEFCNQGPLLTAIERGAFLTQPAHYGQPNLIAVLQTLQEIAAAMHYLHSHHVVHGDLTGGNVLLTSSDKDARGFTAKVVDFGLSRVCEGDGLRTKTMGCAEYMPPELITGGLLTKSGDVYAFGVILWELYCGKRAWAGLKPGDVLERVAGNERLVFPAQTPRRLKLLGEKCTSYNPRNRPSFKEVLGEVNAILSDTMNILQQFLAATNSSSRTENSF